MTDPSITITAGGRSVTRTLKEAPVATWRVQRFGFFVPWKLTNQLNGSHGHWAPMAKNRKRLRQSAAVLVRAHVRTLPAADVPKRITFELRTWNPWDDDALAAACKPLRDGLMDADVIHADGPASGHVFVYTQSVARKARGVWITVEPLT